MPPGDPPYEPPGYPPRHSATDPLGSPATWPASWSASWLAAWPADRPPGLRLSVLRHRWYRLDAAGPAAWDWAPHPRPRFRFDSAAGRRRVRYAAQTRVGAMRERFDEQGRIVSVAELDLQLVELSGPVRVLDLRHERNLDALGLDDQISTARTRPVWAAAQRLSDAVSDWYGERCQGIAYRSRTTPQTSANLVWFGPSSGPVAPPLAAAALGRLGDQDGLLARCVLTEGFAVEGW